MKKILASLMIVAGIGFMAMTPALASSKNENSDGLPNGTHLKVDICHNVDHNPHIVPVSVDATKASQETGHGLLTLNDGAGFTFVSFVPHTGTGGHEHDFVVRVYTKHGNTEVNTYVSERKCQKEETTTTTVPPTTTTTQPPVTTTTTAPPVTTTTQPGVTTTTEPVVTTTTAPVVGTKCVDANGNPFVTSEPTCPVVTTTTTAPVTPAAGTPGSPSGPLPRTGANSTALASFAAGLLMLGLGMRKFVRA